jgi:hypothetical protein
VTRNRFFADWLRSLGEEFPSTWLARRIQEGILVASTHQTNRNPANDNDPDQDDKPVEENGRSRSY